MNRIKYLIKKHIKFLGPKNPFIEGNLRYKCIFIHIPKCAGISIEQALFGEKVGHKNYIDFKTYDAARCMEYTKFTVVRDPIDRFISAFYFLKSGGRNTTDLTWAQKFLSAHNTPADLVESMMTNQSLLDSILKWQHFRPQYRFLIGERNQIEMDCVLRFNHLNADFKDLTKKLGVSATLEHVNKTKSNATRQSPLNPDLVEFLKEQYREDYSRLAEYL